MFEPKRFTITLQTGPDDEDDYLPSEEAQKLVEVASRFRGEVINETGYIEDKLHKYLARYFRNDPKKSDELRKMTLEKKARRFRSIVAKDDVPGPEDDLIYLVRFRNTVAHGKLVYERQMVS